MVTCTKGQVPSQQPDEIAEKSQQKSGIRRCKTKPGKVIAIDFVPRIESSVTEAAPNDWN
jgi:hypothetical protein